MRDQIWAWNEAGAVVAADCADYNRNRARLVGEREDNGALEGDPALLGRTGRVGGQPSVHGGVQGTGERVAAVWAACGRAELRPASNGASASCFVHTLQTTCPQ